MSSGEPDARITRGMRRQLALRRDRLHRGETPIGWKLGFGSRAALEQLGIDWPLVGFLTDRGLLEDGCACSLADWTKPMLEAEIAVHLGRDVPPEADRETVVGAIAGLGTAIELADLDPPPMDPEEILAGNIFHRHVILGPVDETRRSAIGIRARVLRNGGEVARTRDPEALTGELVEIVRYVAELLGGCGETLRAGEVLITGAVVPPLPVAPGDEIAVELAPLGSLAVTFVRGLEDR